MKVTELTHVDVASTLSSLNGSVDSITITNSGSGYLSAPEVLVSGGSGINAKFNATIKDQGISSINIESGGNYSKMLLLLIFYKKQEMVLLYY